MANSGVITTLQLNALMVNTLQVSIFATSMGMMMAAMGPIALTQAPINVEVTDPAIKALQRAYGNDLVSRSLMDFGMSEDIENGFDYPTITELANRIEYHVQRDMAAKYGTYIAREAMAAAPPGDLISMMKIADTLAAKGITPASKPVIKEAAVQQGVVVAIAKAKRESHPVKDTVTGKVYRSENAAGVAVGPSLGFSLTRVNSEGKTVNNNFIWYQTLKKAPKRFVRV